MKNRKKKIILFIACFLAVILISILIEVPAKAQPETLEDPIKLGINIEGFDTPEAVVDSFEILTIFTILTLAPSILIMMTAFTRIIIVLSIVRNALGTQQMPPNQVLIGLALFITFFIMAPIGADINENAIEPYLAGEIVQKEALDRAMEPLRNFMFKQTREKDLALFLNLSGIGQPEILDEIPNHVLIPAFIISELKTAFQIGFLIYIPFIIIDMVVASTLMSMGMMMLPPVMISLPFKILLFVMVDGWNLVIKTLITGFN